ncbi:hypothetical protein EAO77_37165, partial [Streptomyces sp. t39]
MAALAGEEPPGWATAAWTDGEGSSPPVNAEYPAPLSSVVHSWRKAAWRGSPGSRERTSAAYETWCGHSIRRAAAERRSRDTAPSGAVGRVRRMPVPEATMMSAAAIPVSS